MQTQTASGDPVVSANKNEIMTVKEDTQDGEQLRPVFAIMIPALRSCDVQLLCWRLMALLLMLLEEDDEGAQAEKELEETKRIERQRRKERREKRADEALFKNREEQKKEEERQRRVSRGMLM